MWDTVAWQERGLCRDLDPDLFYAPLEFESTEQRITRERAAKAVCRACPVQADCLDWALTNSERLGVWGGKTERERQLLSAAAPGSRARVAAG